MILIVALSYIGIDMHKETICGGGDKMYSRPGIYNNAIL